MRLHLRLADEADERAMQELDGLARGGDAERIALIHQAVAGRRCLVEVDDRIVGYVMTAPRGFFARDFVELLMVDDVVRRRGVGRALLGAAVDSAGTTRVFSSTNESNSAMRSLFASAGWTLSGRLDGLDDGDPELVYFVDQVVGVDIEIRELARDELARVGEIDRTERISMLFEQQGTELVERPGTWDSPPWDPDGHGEHSVAAQRSALEHYADAGGIGRGAFSNGLLVGIGVVVPHLRPGIAQLAFLHVSRRFRSAGLGGRLAADLETIASDAGDTEIVVTATPSENTVRFYLGRGYLPMASPLPELFELEPEDIHLSKPI